MSDLRPVRLHLINLRFMLLWALFIFPYFLPFFTAAPRFSGFQVLFYLVILPLILGFFAGWKRVFWFISQFRAGDWALVASPILLLLSFWFPSLTHRVYLTIFFIAYFIFLFIVIRMRFNGKNQVVIGGMLITIFALQIIFLTLEPRFSPDSFSYFELAKVMPQGFTDVNTIRQYVIPTDLNVSFPPLYPSLVRLFMGFSALELYSGVLLNYLLAVLTLISIGRLFQNFFQKGVLGSLLGALIILNPYYLDELLAARTIPLAIFLTFQLSWFLIVHPLKAPWNSF
jgi:hypothetical protein